MDQIPRVFRVRGLEFKGISRDNERWIPYGTTSGQSVFPFVCFRLARQPFAFFLSRDVFVFGFSYRFVSFGRGRRSWAFVRVEFVATTDKEENPGQAGVFGSWLMSCLLWLCRPQQIKYCLFYLHLVSVVR